MKAKKYGYNDWVYTPTVEEFKERVSALDGTAALLIVQLQNHYALELARRDLELEKLEAKDGAK